MRRVLLFCFVLAACSNTSVTADPVDTVIYSIEIDSYVAAYTPEAIRRDTPIYAYLGTGEAKIPLEIIWDAAADAPVFTRYYKEEPGRSERITPVSVLWSAWKKVYPEIAVYQ
ncbi:hypothetical protein FJZ28_02020 [Candidatus Peregrinibacteria bacterium]|nr:hypothetical protein [Candidatus Peregrinibacteria bacterium]